jgi:UDP-N-acetylmuramoyl-L-alanyl-D-glutamate--2,6-diaminopimelate ligase
LEQVSTGDDDVAVLVDYAHTPDALRRALLALRDLKAQPLICVFGCGGDRDKTKRPQMGQVATELADQVVVTSDNPRTEDPARIVEDIVRGLSSPPARIVLDRPKAIFDAIVRAPSGSTILLAGKGHETYQIIGTEKFPMDDAALARLALKQRPRGSS